MCAHMPLALVVPRGCWRWVFPALQIWQFLRSLGVEDTPFAPYLSDQPWVGPREGLRYFSSFFLKTANVTSPRVLFGKFPPFPSIKHWQAGSLLQPLPQGDIDQALWRGRAWVQGIYAPQSSLLSPLLFCTATTSLSACWPWARPPRFDTGGLHSLVFMKAWGWQPVVSGGCWCCKVGEMQEVEYCLQSLPEAQSAGLSLCQQPPCAGTSRGAEGGLGGLRGKLTSNHCWHRWAVHTLQNTSTFAI